MRFHAFTFAGSRGSCLRDPASVNAMEQTRVIVILVYYTLFQPKTH